MDPLRLVVVSNDAASRNGLESIFRPEPSFALVGSFALADIVEHACNGQPDVVLLDVSGRPVDYLEPIRRIKNGCPCCFILALVGEQHFEQLLELLDCGVDGCLPKGLSRPWLVRMIELAAKAGIIFLPMSAKKLLSLPAYRDLPARIPTPPAASAPPGAALTRRELEVLRLMARNYSNRDIAATIFISEATVKSHVSNILRKLDQPNRMQAVVFAYQTGLIEQPAAGRPVAPSVPIPLPANGEHSSDLLSGTEA